MNPLAVFLLIGPMIAFVTAVHFALLNGGEWSLPEIAGVLTLAVVTGAAFARIAFAAAGTGLPF
jgi:uncharacterized integral membrane protein